MFLLFGVVFGVIFQRSRFCLVRAFREPFMTGDAEHTRAAALALAVSTLGFAILKFVDLKDKGDWVFPGAGVGALAGGTIFGIGMTLAGGCGAGSIWRAGEGQVKLWAALVACFALGASLVRLALVQTGTLSKLGVGRVPAVDARLGRRVVLTLLVVVAWAVRRTWNEEMQPSALSAARADSLGGRSGVWHGSGEFATLPTRAEGMGMGGLTRREFLKSSSGAVVATAGWRAVPAVPASSRPSGAAASWSSAAGGAARRRRSTCACADPSIEVVLLEPNRRVRLLPVQQPGPERRAHHRQPHASATTACASAACRFIHETATAIEPDTKRVRVGEGYLDVRPARRLARASTSSGSRSKGWPRARTRCSTRGRPGRRRSSWRISSQAMPDGGVFVLTVPPRRLPLPARALRAHLPGGLVPQDEQAASPS